MLISHWVLYWSLSLHFIQILPWIPPSTDLSRAQQEPTATIMGAFTLERCRILKILESTPINHSLQSEIHPGKHSIFGKSFYRLLSFDIFFGITFLLICGYTEQRFHISPQTIKDFAFIPIFYAVD